MTKLRFGVLSTAKIAREQVIPPMQRGEYTEITAIASRDKARAETVAKELGIAKAYGSYEEMLADAEIDAVYNPLPNHLHVPWTVKAAEAGKHVLCEKPIAITTDEAKPLLEARDRHGVYIQEAFMVLTNPQWKKAKAMVEGGEIGELRAIQGFFSYMNLDAGNIRNMADIGGGGVLDIGCYPIVTSRFVTGKEPRRVVATLDRDPELRIDRLTTAILEFEGAGDCPVHASFTCSTQLVPYQRMHFFGTKGRLDVMVPFNAFKDRPNTLRIDDGAERGDGSAKVIEIATCDQYGVAGDAFAKAIIEKRPQPIPLESTMANMRVLDAVFRSAESGRWESP